MGNIEKLSTLMVQLRFTSLLLPLLVSLLVGLKYPTVLAGKEVATVANNDQSLKTVEDQPTHHETRKIADSTPIMKRLGGRKIGVNTGEDMTTSGKPYGTSNITKDYSALAANAEIFKLMSKDYHSSPHRRPPINNNVPLEDHDEAATP